MDNHNNSFNQKQREMFARLLADAKKRAEAELEPGQSLDDQVKSEVVPKLAEERGASELIAKLRTLRKEVEDAEEALDDLGFSCDEDSVSLKWDAPKNLRNAVEAAKLSAQKERNAALRKYDLGIVGVWATEDIQKVKKIVEDLL
jgi:hypothetical protein